MGDWWDQKEDASYQNVTGGSMELFAGNIPGEATLGEMMLDHLKAAETKRPRRSSRSDGFHASAIGKMCLRYETLKRAIPRERDQKIFPPTLLRRFQAGHIIHDGFQVKIFGKMRVLKGNWVCSRCTRVQEDCLMPTEPCPRCRWQVNPDDHSRVPSSRKSVDCATGCTWEGGYDAPGRDCVYCFAGGAWKFDESRIEIKEWDVVGHYDGKVLYNGHERILELKTKDTFAFKKMTAPHPEHIVQASVYMWGSGLREAVIIYVEKNSFELKEFIIQYDEALIERIKEDITYVRQALEDNELPNGVCGNKKDKMAKECAYKDACFLGIDDIDEMAKWEQKRKLPIAGNPA
jgi:CRISPR/Cas system-associated exonuclease Cas4 (RecB family)